VDFSPPKWSKYEIFGINKSTLVPSFTVLASKMWTNSPHSAKIANFGINFPNRYIPLSNFYQIWHGEEVPHPHSRAEFHRCGFKSAGLQPPNEKNANFGITLLQRGIHTQLYSPSKAATIKNKQNKEKEAK